MTMKFYSGNKKDRILPLILAGIMVASTLLGFFGFVKAYATVGESAYPTGKYVFLDKDGDEYKNNELTSGEGVNIRAYFYSDIPVDIKKEARLQTNSFTYDTEANGVITGPNNGIYTVTFNHISYTGYGNSLKFMITYENEQTEILSLPISECKSYKDDDDDDDDKEPAPAKPYIILSNYSFGGSSVTAGSTFQLKMKFYNTSPEISVENIVMEINSGDSFTLANSSNKVFIKRLYAGESLEKSIDLRVLPNAEPKSGIVEVSFTYDYIVDNVRQPSVTCSEKISIPIYQINRFEIGNIEVPEFAVAGEEAYLTIKLVNKGKTTIYNVSAEVRGDFLNSGASEFIGNIESGVSKTCDDLYVKSANAGDVAGELIIHYEDATGAQYQIPKTFMITFEGTDDKMNGKPGFPGDMIDDTMGGKTDQQQGFNKMWIIGIAAAVLAAGGIAAVVIVKLVKKRKAMEDEDI